MNVMRKIIGILAVLVIAMAFIGAGSAASAGYSDVTITPATSLSPGQIVTAVFKVNLPADSISDTDTLTFSSPLENAKWEIKIFKGEANKNSQNPASTMTGTSKPNVPYKPSMFAIYYDDQDVTLVVSFSGTVSSASKGSSINVINVLCSSSKVGSYTSPAQKVYNPADFASNLATLNKDIASTEQRIVKYAAYGIDTSAATQNIASAKTRASAAQAAGTGNIITANSNLEAGEAFVTNAERTLALAGLKAANTNIVSIGKIADTLYERKWNTEAQYLETKVTSMKYSYDSLAAVYNGGGNPDAVKLDALVNDSYTVLDLANEYLEDSKIPKFVRYLPIVIGVIVGIGAVVGVVFLIRRRRANSWDELG